MLEIQGLFYARMEQLRDSQKTIKPQSLLKFKGSTKQEELLLTKGLLVVLLSLELLETMLIRLSG
jgi:hypothetical protein